MNIVSGVLVALIVIVIVWGVMAIRRTRPAFGHQSTTSPQEKEPEKKWNWKWQNIRWGWVILILLCLPLIWPIVKTIGLAWIAGMDYHVRGTDPADHGLWGKSPPPPQPRPAPDQLLRWNAGAKVQMREQSSPQMAYNGVCFVDVIPPNTKPEYKISCAPADNGLPYQTYLVDQSHNASKFRSPWELAQRAVSQENVRKGIVLIEQLCGNGMLEHSFFITNYTGGGREAPVLCEEYLQISDQMTHEVCLDRLQDHRAGIYQSVAEVTMDESSFIVQDNRFKWLWIAPVHCKDWQLQVGETSVPSKGMDEGAREMFKGLNGDNPLIAPFAITVNVGDKEVPLEKAILLEPKDISSGKVTLRVNAPQGKWLEGKLKPAKILVGYQL